MLEVTFSKWDDDECIQRVSQNFPSLEDAKQWDGYVRGFNPLTGEDVAHRLFSKGDVVNVQAHRNRPDGRRARVSGFYHTIGADYTPLVDLDAVAAWEQAEAQVKENKK